MMLGRGSRLRAGGDWVESVGRRLFCCLFFTINDTRLTSSTRRLSSLDIGRLFESERNAATRETPSVASRLSLSKTTTTLELPFLSLSNEISSVSFH